MACLIYKGLATLFDAVAFVNLAAAFTLVDPLLMYMEDNFDVSGCEAAGCH